ncbi:MAG: sulfatase-like hydrolase/transferase, partial [Azoarcus sp.]|nr:sulfatase-like hydrolase/transferase [Azoarcus sp.]
KLNSTQLNSTQLNSTQLNSTQLNSTQLNSTQLNSTQQKAGELYVLIIGESSGRDTLHAYGGPAKNTPWLDRFKDQENVLFFQNAYAPHTYTVAALTHALTDGRMATGATFPRGQNIVGVSKANDFHTVWISNQRMVGPFSTPIGALASTAHESFFTTGAYEGYNDDVPPDEAVLPLVKSYLEKHDFSRNTLLVIHLIGSHLPYVTRYPKNFPLVGELDRAHMGDAFTSPKALELFSTLATSQKYTDGILKEIFALFEKYQDKPIAAAYFSDHGESPFSYAKHGVSGHDSKKVFDWSMSRIPFFMWYSPTFFRLHPEKIATLKKRVDAPFTNDLVFDFYVGLSGIKAESYRSQFDIGNDDYGVTRENAFVTGKRFLSEDPDFIIRKNLENIRRMGIPVAIHRTNTIFKYHQAKKYLRNFELDLMLMKDGRTQKTELMVGHNIAHRADMTFRQYLSELSNNFDFLWLDIKNLNKKTSKQILVQLTEFDKEFDLKKRVLVESPSAELLSVFTRNGWKTSLYITGNDINRIKDNVLKYKLKGVGWHVTTMDPRMLDKLRKVLPADVMFYGWAAPEWSLSDLDLIKKISKFSSLRMFLLTLESNFDIAGHASDFDPNDVPPDIPQPF